MERHIALQDFLHPNFTGLESLKYDEITHRQFDMDLTDEDYRRLEGFVRDIGMCEHILAYYHPLHQDGEGGKRWGIYLVEEGVKYLAKKISIISENNDYPLEVNDCVTLSMKKLMLHEQFHYAVEVIATYLQDTHHRPYYLPYLDDKSRDLNKKLVEEGLCNSFVSRSSELSLRKDGNVGANPLETVTSVDFKPYIHQIMNDQPAGYKHYKKYTRQPYRKNSLRRVLHNITNRSSYDGDFNGLKLLFNQSLSLKTAKNEIPYYIDYGTR